MLKGIMGNAPITLAGKRCPFSLIELQVQDKILEHHYATGSTSNSRTDFSLYHREKGISFPFLKIVTKFADLKMTEISQF